MSALAHSLALAANLLAHHRFAIVGGIAVSPRTEPRGRDLRAALDAELAR